MPVRSWISLAGVAVVALTMLCIGRPVVAQAWNARGQALVDGATPSGTLLASDDCSDPTSGIFPRSSDVATWTVGCVDGAYQMEATSPVTLGSPARLHFVLSSGSYTDTSVAADVSLAAGGDAHTAAGLGCRYSGGGSQPNGYRLYYLVSTAAWNLGRVDAGVFVPLTGGQAATPLSIPSTDSTHLQLTCSGSTIAVAVNGTEVFSVQDGTYQQGRVALTVGEETVANAGGEVYSGYTGI